MQPYFIGWLEWLGTYGNGSDNRRLASPLSQPFTRISIYHPQKRGQHGQFQAVYLRYNHPLPVEIRGQKALIKPNASKTIRECGSDDNLSLDTPHTLKPLFSAYTDKEYLQLVQENWNLLRTDHIDLKPSVEAPTIPGYCIPCQKSVEFQVDLVTGDSASANPNWRESLLCPSCLLSNRQRIVASLVSQAVTNVPPGQQIYLMEQVTPLTEYLSKTEKIHSVIGSEYFGSRFTPGQSIWPWHHHLPINPKRLLRSAITSTRFALRMLSHLGFRHEDIEHLSFKDASLDLIVSNDVFEHIANPLTAFRECSRTLKPGGMMIATFPYFSGLVNSRTRASLAPDGIKYILPAEYHGDPISASGSLVFTDFGGDIFTMFHEAGFKNARIDVFNDVSCGHIGGAPVFILTR